MSEEQQQPKKHTKLEVSMIGRVTELIDLIDPATVNIQLAAKKRDTISPVGVIDDLNADDFFFKSSNLVGICLDYSKVSKAFYLEAKRKNKVIRSKIFSDLGSSKEKLTVDSKNALVELDKDVARYTLLENSWLILSEYFAILHDDMMNVSFMYKEMYRCSKQVQKMPTEL